MSLAGDKHWPSGPTGRYLVTLGDSGAKTAARVLRDVAGLRSASSSDWRGGFVAAEAIVDARGLVFEHVGVAVADLDADQLAALRAAIADGRSPVIAVEPEQYVHALAGAGAGVLGAGGIATPYTDNSYFTWGLQATGVDRSGGSARGIRVAVLDSGLDLGHPDFQGRAPVTVSFVSGQSAQDGYGHGTHCIGTSCGRRHVSSASRAYGIASDAGILVGKVLNDNGWGADAWIIAGINWAVAQQAAVISMSLGSLVVAGAGYVQAYENAAQAALAAGSLVIAAAGQLSVGAGGGGGGFQPASRRFFLHRAQRPRRRSQPGRPRRQCFFQHADAIADAVHGWHQHGDAACRRLCSAVGARQRAARPGAVGKIAGNRAAAGRGRAAGRRRPGAGSFLSPTRSAAPRSGSAARP